MRTFVCVVSFFGIGCRGEQEFPPPMPRNEPIDVGTDYLMLTDPDKETYCWASQEPVLLRVSAEQPLTFAIYGPEDASYCAHFERMSGYLTLSHDHGDVTRDDDAFHFCGETVALDTPLTVTASALTPEITFSIWLERL